MKYQSTRGQYWCAGAAQAIKMGLSPDGGLFVPESIPTLSAESLENMRGMDYPARACTVLSAYLKDFTSSEIEHCVSEAYLSGRFDHPAIAPLHRLEAGVHVQELWHGPTCAFKDMALQVLPHLLTTSIVKTGEDSRILILVATSGDTGKAALEGFRDVAGTSIIVFFPEDGVSEVQKRQMVTQEGENVFVAAVQGNFDDAQNGVKNIFADRKMEETLQHRGIKLSSANSINWGRLAPQIVYYASAYLDLLETGEIKPGEAMNVVVPTGNFGNILAAFYARCMGIHIGRLVCASNANNVLTDFIQTGSYDRMRHFHKTLSPSMDILISSNLERLLFELTGRDARPVSTWMEELKLKGRYTVDQQTRQQVQDLFWADYSTDDETLETITSTWNDNHYLVDTHTAVAINVYRKYLARTGDATPTVIASTASPYKFGGSAARALLGDRAAGYNEFDILQLLQDFTKVPIPQALRGLESKPVRFQQSTAKEKMGELVLAALDSLA
ncbi:MAG TPA: threonine synthase [Syntrophomonadaceae bacterium]|nr:threonine synthase [Syntrophomonadaceae bacterium]